MTVDEIISVMDTMTAAWPWAEVTEEQLGLWCHALEDIDASAGSFAIDRAVKTLDRPPTIAWFREQARIETERTKPRPTPELGAGEPLKDRRAELIALMRSTLATPYHHDHHKGLASCETCVSALERHIAEGCEHHSRHRHDLEAIGR